MSIPNFRFATEMISREEPEEVLENIEEEDKGNILDNFEEETIEEETPITDQEEVEEQNDEITDEDKQYYKQLFDYYKKDGFFTEEEEFDGDPEKFEELLNKKKVSLVTDAQELLLAQLPDNRKRLLEYTLANPNATDEDILNFFEVDNYQPIDVDLFEDEKTSREFLKTYLMQERGDDEETANDYLDVLEDKGKLNQQAKQIAKHINDQQEQLREQKIQEAQQIKQARNEQYKKFHDGFVDSLNSLEWDKKIKKEIYNTMYSNKLTELSNEVFKHPLAAIQLVNYMRFFDPKTGKIDETEFEKSAFNPTMKKAKSKIQQSFRSSDAGSGNKKDSSSTNKKKSIKYAFAKQ